MRRKPMQNGMHRNNSGGGRHQRGGGGKPYRSHGGGGGHDYGSLARQKKHALTQKEKYLGMARDALTNGDRVEAEYYYQHVEHYSRLVGEIMAKEQPRQQYDHYDHPQAQADFEPESDHGAFDEVEDTAEEAEPEEVRAAPRPQQARPPRGRGRPPRRQEGEQETIPLPNTLFAEEDGNRDFA